MSNKFSSARSIQKRPKVCKPPPPPPPPEGPTCEVEPSSITLEFEEDGEVSVKANNEAFPTGSPIAVEWVGDECIDIDGGIGNNEEFTEIEVTSGCNEGTFVGLLLFEWEDESQCSKPFTVIQLEIPE